jgi:predicted nucleic acid-binding protein
MKTYFLDTSALVKRYHQEVGTGIIDEIFGEEGKVLFISDLSIIEFHSAIALKVRTREISRDAFFHLIGLFSNELDRGLYQIRRIDEEEKQEAVKLLTKGLPENNLSNF